MKREVGKETAELLGVFVNKIAPFWGNKGNPSVSIKQFMPCCCKNWAAESMRDLLDDSSGGKALSCGQNRGKERQMCLGKRDYQTQCPFKSLQLGKEKELKQKEACQGV